MILFGGSRSLNWKRWAPLVLTLAVTLSCGMDAFLSSSWAGGLRMACAEGEPGTDLKKYLELLKEDESRRQEALEGSEQKRKAQEAVSKNAIKKHGSAKRLMEDSEKAHTAAKKGYDPGKAKTDAAALTTQEPRLKELNDGLRKAMAERTKKDFTKDKKDQAFNQAGKKVKSAKLKLGNAKRGKDKEKIETATRDFTEFQSAERTAKAGRDAAQGELDEAKRKVVELEAQISSIESLRMQVKRWTDQQARIDGAKETFDNAKKDEATKQGNKDTASEELNNVTARVLQQRKDIKSVEDSIAKLKPKVIASGKQETKILAAKEALGNAKKDEAAEKDKKVRANKELNGVTSKVLQQSKAIQRVQKKLILLQQLVAESDVLDLRESWKKDYRELLQGRLDEEKDVKKKAEFSEEIKKLGAKIKEPTAKNPRPAAPSPKPVANGGEQVQVLKAIARLEARLEDGLQVEGVAAPSEAQAGSDNLLFYLSLLVVVLCTVFALALELNNRKSKTAYGLARDQAVGEKEEAQEQLDKALENVVATVLAWEEKTAGEGPKVVELDVQIRDRMDQQRDSNQELRDTFNRLSELVVGMQTDARTSDHANRGDFEKLKESIALATTFAEGQKEEISSYKEGYHWASTGTFIKGVIRVVDLIDDLAACEPGPVAGLDDTKRELLNLLGNNEVEAFAPAVGEPFNNHTKKGSPAESEAVETRAVAAGEPAGMIEEVRRPGYRLELAVEGDEYRIIRPAMVVVSVAAKVDPDARQEAPGEKLDEAAAGGQAEAAEETTEETGEGSES